MSPDGGQVTFHTPHQEIFIVDASSGDLRKVAEQSLYATWSPDGRSLAVAKISTMASDTGIFTFQTQTIDLKTGRQETVPESEGKIGGFWLSPMRLVTGYLDSTGFSLFAFSTRKWTEFAKGSYPTWLLSSNRQYLYCTTGGPESAKVVRIRISDGHVQTIASLEGIRRAEDGLEQPGIRLAPDDSPIITRDIGTQEIYALDLRWP